MPDNHYENSKLADIYDLDSPWSIDRDFYLSLADSSTQTILDLGCGTGLLCNAYAERNHDVTGVDPSAAMLKVARQKPHANKIEWVESVAQEFKSNKRFDVIIMTGHAFQVLLEDRDVQLTIEAMRDHLKPDGLIVFESRNPAINWASAWNYEMVLQLPSGVQVIESRRFHKFENDRMSFELRYQFPDETLTSESELRFWSKNEIEEKLMYSGFRIDKVLGDWNGKLFDEQCSEEMIFMARLASH